MCMSKEKFLKSWQVTDKIIESIFLNSHLTIYEWLKLNK